MTSWMICMTIQNPQQPNNLYMKSYNYLKPILLGLLSWESVTFVLLTTPRDMKDRLPPLVEAKDQGLVGEGTDGFVYLRKVILKK